MATKLTIYACRSALTASIVRSTVDRLIRQGITPTEVRANDSMMAAWEYVGLSAVYILKSGQVENLPEHFKDILREKPKTMAGIPLYQDATVPIDVVRFLCGEDVVAEIEQLAIPVGYGD